MGCGGSTTTKVETVHIQQGSRKNSAPTRRPKSVEKVQEKKKPPSKQSSRSSSASSIKSSGSKSKTKENHDNEVATENHGQHDFTGDNNERNKADVLRLAPSPVTDISLTQKQETEDDNDEGVFDEDIVEADPEEDNLPSLVFPTSFDESKENVEYTLDDVVQHNTEKGWNEWFLYGRRVYDVTLLLPIVKDRMEAFIIKCDLSPLTADSALKQGYPVYAMMDCGVKAGEVKKVLRTCIVGKLIPIPRDEFLRRLKQSVEDVINELESIEEKTVYAFDQLAQYTRWLQAFPQVETENKTPSSVSGNPNDAEFQLPEGISTDPLLLRNWTEAWEVFDTDVPEEGAWVIMKPELDPLGDTQSVFADLVSEYRPEQPAFDMEIEGEAAWDVITLDILKNDVTTPQQDEIWKSRENRKDLHDPKRMEKRRDQIAQYFMIKYERGADWLEKYMNFAAIMESNMTEFLKVCETFDPSQVPPPIEYNLPPPSEWKAGTEQPQKTTEGEEQASTAQRRGSNASSASKSSARSRDFDRKESIASVASVTSVYSVVVDQDPPKNDTNDLELTKAANH